MTVKTVLKISAALSLAVCLSQCSQPKGPDTFEVALNVTPAAADKLNALSKKIEVSGYYFGLPTEASAPKANEAGEINLGEDLVDVAGKPQTVHMSGTGIDIVAQKSIKGETLVVVSAYLDPTAGMDNILTCTSFKGTLKDAQAKPVAITCDLKS